jgi:hypothetical protein
MPQRDHWSPPFIVGANSRGLVSDVGAAVTSLQRQCESMPTILGDQKGSMGVGGPSGSKGLFGDMPPMLIRISPPSEGSVPGREVRSFRVYRPESVV